MGHSYSALTLRSTANGNILALYRGCVTLCSAEGEAEEILVSRIPYEGNKVTLRLHFEDGGSVHYGYVLSDGREKKLSGLFCADKSTWSGAKPALFARNVHNAAGGSAFYSEISFSKEG